VSESGRGALGNSAIAAYQAGDLHYAIDCFRKSLKSNPFDWHLRLFLAMSYAKVGRLMEARLEFMDIREFANDPDLRARAASGLQSVMEAITKGQGG
jgi:Flp pilus assembly protein TadD